MTTVSEVKQMAGELLGIVSISGALDANQDAKLAEAYDQEYDMLRSDGLAIWASDGTIPDRVAPHLAALMAFNKVEAFKKSSERYSMVLAKRNAAMPAIRKAVTPSYESTDDPVDY